MADAPLKESLGIGTDSPNTCFYLIDRRTVGARNSTFVTPYWAVVTALRTAKSYLAVRNYRGVVDCLQEAEKKTLEVMQAASKWHDTTEELAKVGLDTVMAISSAARELLQRVEHPEALKERHDSFLLGPQPPSPPTPTQHGQPSPQNPDAATRQRMRKATKHKTQSKRKED